MYPFAILPHVSPHLSFLSVYSSGGNVQNSNFITGYDIQCHVILTRNWQQIHVTAWYFSRSDCMGDGGRALFNSTLSGVG
jgi:hypothetical protein